MMQYGFVDIVDTQAARHFINVRQIERMSYDKTTQQWTIFFASGTTAIRVSSAEGGKILGVLPLLSS